MKIAQVNASDYVGGASRAAARLHVGLRAIGVDSEMIVMKQSHHLDHVKPFVPSSKFARRVARALTSEYFRREAQGYVQRTGFGITSSDRSKYGGELAKQLSSYDLVNLHWVAGMFDYRDFMAQLAGRQSLVWTLHDMNPFTGGCHYDENCGRFTAKCGACPQLKSTVGNDPSRRIWQRKQQAFTKLADFQLTIVAPSHWLTAECRRSSLLGRFQLETIPYGLELEQFKPRDPAIIRRMLDIPDSAFLVLALADTFQDRRKGFAYIQELMREFSADEELYFLLVGTNGKELTTPRTRRLGKTGDDRLLSFVYSAADVFVIPTLQDNLPNTVLESIACGTPVVGFDVGGVGDMVRPEESGFITPVGETTGLARALRTLRDDRELCRQLSHSSRALAEREYSLELQGRRYRDLYTEILNRPAPMTGRVHA